MRNKKLLLGLGIALLGASCNPFATPTTYGIVKTVNGGADWQFTNQVRNQDATLDTLEVSKLGLDPQNREIVYASAYNGGLYKSDDSGTTWSLVLSKIFIYDFVISPRDPKILYVAGTFGNHGKLLYTRDGGATWQDIYNEESEDNPVTSVAVDPNGSNQIVIGLRSGNLVKSSDSGISWRLVRAFGDRINQVLWQNGSVYVLLRQDGLLKSTDTGETFTELTTALTARPLTERFFTSEGSPTFSRVYVDTASPSLIYLTTAGKLYKTTDEGAEWTQLTLPMEPVSNGPRPVAVARSSSNVVYTSVGSTMYKSTNAGTSWQTQAIATDGVINYILIDPELPQITYAGIDIRQ